MRVLLCCVVALCLGTGCGEPEPSEPAAGDATSASVDGSANYPPTARPQLHDELRKSALAPRHPSDGGGSASVRSGPTTVPAGRPDRWSIRYVAGPLGVQDGGTVSFLVGPFWYWSPPQTRAPNAAGFTRVTTPVEGLDLETHSAQEKLYITLRGRALAEGESIDIEYGAGELRAQPDRYAERDARFWIGVDGDGDGVEGVLSESPTIDIAPGPAAELLLFWPSTAQPGQTVQLSAAVVDAGGNAVPSFTGEVLFETPPEGVALPDSVSIAAEDQGHVRVPVELESAGVFRIRGRVADLGAQLSESNPILVGEGQGRILWGELHGHSQLTDGTGTPEDYFTYARDVSALDVVALTDHDHWGVRFLDENPAMWERIRDATKAAHAPGEFVTLLGYEWTSWLYGHRHVLYFGDEGEVYSSLDEETDHPTELWEALRGQSALTFAHHPAGGPIATDWSIPPDPEMEPLTEIVSVHGCSEARDAPAQIYAGVSGNFVRDQLDRGYQLGFVGSGDGHDGHPGLAHRNALSGGLAAILAKDHTRKSVLAALRARRVYATNGHRIVLRTSLAGHRMGSTVAANTLSDPANLTLLIIGTGPLEYLDVIHRGNVIRLALEGAPRFIGDLPIPEMLAGDYLYVRVIQENGGVAWSSPFFIE